MNKKAMVAALVGVIAVVAAGGYVFMQRNTAKDAQQSGQTVSAEVLFQTRFNDLDGKPQSLAQWRGKVMVVNFWATWCPPCRDEIPEFVDLQEKYRENGLIFVGIALDEKDKVRAFADEMGINYPVLLGEIDAANLSRKLGNRLGALPFTVIIGRSGHIVSTEMGQMTQAMLEPLIQSLL
jgi:thiol-disulfide isomerase/thioredoxin